MFLGIAAKPPPPPSPIDQQARVPPDGISKKTMQVQRQVDEVTEIMQQNINKVLQRGENIDSLQTKTEEMSVSAQAFQRKAKSTRRKMYWQKIRLTLFILFLIIAIVLIILGPILKLF
ncbi:hypothetical protein BB559_006833 [Furculomyces boomerangus]|uniref:V-SNARE coiled-coil homology domain-containing protein n=1 Tax=Furculomyces boomerangus TaxID=61424 RepID=A0A2T9Y0B2_9FUNG|nr:hypothetical protein BB559_006833 [Furculomyces boomerangus]